MILPLLLTITLLFVAVKPSKDVLLRSYCSVSQTQTIKGFFVIIVFFSHFCSYVSLDTWYDSAMQKCCGYLGQLMVAPFLFYSGYGIFESVKKKGPNYIAQFPKKRILKVLLHFDLAVFLFLALDVLIERLVALCQFALSLIAWESIGNSAWFVFAILCAYVFAYVGLRFFKNNLKCSLVVITVLMLLYIVIMCCFKPEYWYDTILAFPLGCTLSLFKENINLFVSKKFVALGWGGLNIIALLIAKIGLIPSGIINSQIAFFALCGIMIFLSFHFRLESKILSWFGPFVFEIYILQRLSMNLGKYLHWNESNRYLYFVLCFITTLLLAFIFKKVSSRIGSKLFN